MIELVIALRTAHTLFINNSLHLMVQQQCRLIETFYRSFVALFSLLGARHDNTQINQLANGLQQISNHSIITYLFPPVPLGSKMPPPPSIASTKLQFEQNGISCWADQHRANQPDENLLRTPRHSFVNAILSSLYRIPHRPTT